MNSDTPVKSIVDSLTGAEKARLEAKLKKSEAIKNVESRRLGPFSGVIWFAGDYE